MARLSGIFVPGPMGTETISSSSAGTAQTIGLRAVFQINGDGDLMIAFGNSGGTTASATASSFRIPSGQTLAFDLGEEFDQFMLYNPDGSNSHKAYWVQLVS